MALSAKSRVALLVGVGIILSSGYAWARGTTWSRAQNLFATLETGFERGHPKAILGQIHPEYDYFGHWPELEQIRPIDGDAPQPSEENQGRLAAGMALRQVFLMSLQDSPDFTWTLKELQPSGDSLFEATVDFALINRDNPRLNVEPHQDFVFTLRQDGLLWPSMRIIDHTPVDYP